jgi:hypothetical protein
MGPKKKHRRYAAAPEAGSDAKAEQEKDGRSQDAEDDEEKLSAERERKKASFIKRIMRFALTSDTVDLDDDGDDNDSTKDEARKKFPRFGDLSFYSVHGEDRNSLWKLEAERLMKAARGTVDGLVFPSKQAPPSFDRDGFVQLANVTNLVLCALHICFLDDQMVLAEFHAPSFNAVRWSQSESALRNRVHDSHDLPGQSFRPSYAPGGLPSSTRPSQAGWEAPVYYEEDDDDVLRMRRGAVTVVDRLDATGEDDEDGTKEELREATGELSKGSENIVGAAYHTTSRPENNATFTSNIRTSSHVSEFVSRSSKHMAMGTNFYDAGAASTAATVESSTLGGPSNPSQRSGDPQMVTEPNIKGEEAKKADIRQHKEDGERKTLDKGKQAEGRRDGKVHFKLPEKPTDSNKLGEVTNPEQFFAIVDFVTSILARIATECAPSSYWRTVVLACLMKLSTKLKVVTIDLPAYAQQCLRRGREGVASRIAREYHEEAAARGVPLEEGANELQFPRITDDDAVMSRYCVENATVGRWLGNCILHSLLDLGARRPLHVPLDHLDLSALLFRAGARGLPTLIHQDRHGNIGGSVQALSLVFSTRAMHLAADLGRAIKKQAQDHPAPEDPAGGAPLDNKAPKARMQISWETLREDGGVDIEPHEILLTDTASVVTVLVPLSLVKPPLAQEFQVALQAMSALSAFGEISPPAIKFTASVTLWLAGTEPLARADSEEVKDLFKRRLSRNKLEADTTVVVKDSNSLSGSLLAKRRLNLFDSHAPDITFSTDETTVKQTIENANTRLEKMQKMAKDWDIDGSAILVKCPVYVWMVVFFSTILVIGGLLIGFLVGDRITGVDPFGITTYTWVGAGFLILVAKSVRVSEWPWQEFLRGKVTCRSVTELRKVTGMDAQDIIRFFLSTQEENMLTTRGPFNKSFRNTDKEGFSIDVKPELETLMSCGLIPLKVSTLQGPSLVFLNLTPGGQTVSVDHSMRTWSPYRVWLCCPEPPAVADGGDAALVVSPAMYWIKILGLYNLKGIKFR